jgi:hypothetical protein
MDNAKSSTLPPHVADDGTIAVECCLHVREVQKIGDEWITVVWRQGYLAKSPQTQPDPLSYNCVEPSPVHSADRPIPHIDLRSEGSHSTPS